MPQAAIGAIAGFLAGAGVNYAIAQVVATVFVYAASSYLLNRAAQALTPRRRSGALGGGNLANFYDGARP